MVRSSLFSMAKSLTNYVRSDLGALSGLLFDRNEIEIGLHTYRIKNDDGSKTIHLRIEQDGSGVLFVDVTDVIHLNSTAAAMAKLALDQVPIETAAAVHGTHIWQTDHAVMIKEMSQIYGLIDGFRTAGDTCPTCAASGLERSPLFSIRAEAPYKADLALTYGCNNHCAHCYNEPERFDMPSLDTKGWIEVINKLHSIGVPHLIFTGGEATLHPDLPFIIQHADKLGLICGLNSNGRRFAHLPYVRELEDVGLNHVQITLGSSRRDLHNRIMGADCFDQTIKGLRNALSSSLHVITNTTLMRCNMDHVDEIIDFLFEMGIRTFAMNGMIYSGGGFSDPNAIPEEKLPALLVRVRDHAADLGMRFLWYTPTEYCRMSPVELEIGAKRCNAGEYSICIEPNGDVLPCQSFYVSAGNLLVDKWEYIWQGDLFRSFRDRDIDPKWAGLPTKCFDCPDLPLCGGGCRIERQARSGLKANMEAAPTGCASGCGIVNASPVGAVGFIPPKSVRSSSTRSNGQNAAHQDGRSIFLNEFLNQE